LSRLASTWHNKCFRYSGCIIQAEQRLFILTAFQSPLKRGSRMQILFAEVTMNLDGAYYVAVLSRVLHIATAIVLVGGLFYLRAMVQPFVLQSGGERKLTADYYYGTARKRWAMIVMAG